MIENKSVPILGDLAGFQESKNLSAMLWSDLFWCAGKPEGLGVFCSRNGAFPSLRIIFPGFVFSVSGFGFLFLDLGFWFPAVFFVPLPVLFLPAVSSLLQAIRLGGEISQHPSIRKCGERPQVSCRSAKLSSWNGNVYWFLLPFGDLDFRSHWKDPVNSCAH